MDFKKKYFLEKKLKEKAERILQYYAATKNWYGSGGNRQSEAFRDRWKCRKTDMVYGGRRARNYFRDLEILNGKQ